MGVGARGFFEVQRTELRDPEHGRTPRGTTRRLLGAALYGALITGVALVNAGCSGIVASNSQASPSSFTITTSKWLVGKGIDSALTYITLSPNSGWALRQSSSLSLAVSMPNVFGL